MLGAVVGDIVGSVFEGGASTSEEFDLFNIYGNITDDTVCTIAVSEWMQDLSVNNFIMDAALDGYLRKWVKAYPGRGYGGRFYDWVHNLRINPPNSLANGAVMRISSVGHLGKDLQTCMDLAKKACFPTHNHPEAIEAAQLIAGAIFLYRQQATAEDVFQWVSGNSTYEFFENVSDFLKFSDSYNQKARSTAIVALNISFLAKNFEDGMRKLCVLGGDTDTTCATAGGLLEARFGVPVHIAKEAKKFLMQDMIDVLEKQYQITGQTISWNLDDRAEQIQVQDKTSAVLRTSALFERITRFFNQRKK